MRTGREVQLHAVLAGRRALAALHPLALAVALLGIDEVDARRPEDAHQLVEVLGRRGKVRGKQIVDLVVEQVPLLLADDDELPYFVEPVFKRQGQNLLR
jgi:hypothetical protein